MNAREPYVMYLGALFASVAAIGLALGDALPQALILGGGAAFLVYWGRREAERRGER